ncbi:hypothetical protein N431DRAFT_551707 [Stipitochalara longipes BDJ]|nr:hypothetical protein N431DRAFT_551707 [Stipitochalara longipes BDJ]
MGSDKNSDRKRGRPLKDSGNSSVSEERRLQVRRAQITYRNRKDAATKALEQRVLFLEESLEEIGNDFVNFTESMLKAEAIQQNPEILQDLLMTTSKITRLARSAAPEPPEATKDEKIENFRSSAREEIFSAKERLPSIRPMPSGKSNIVASNQTAPSFPLPGNDIFGNGWFNLKPSVAHLSIGGASQSDPNGDFAIKLIEKTLNMAYYSLLEYRHDSSSSLVMRMCRYALLYHSMDEILFNLRWFLGPGLLAMQSLCSANFGFDHTLSAQSFNASASGNEAKVLSPFVDAQALVESSNKIPRLAFMNALDVEEYLKSKGAVHLDQDIVQIRIQGSSEVEGIEKPLLNFDHSRSKFDSLGDDEYFDPTLAPLEQNMFGMPELTPVDSYFTPNSSPTQFQIEPVQSRTISICRSSLLENLARNSLCLGTGPAYPRASVDIAIESAIR